MRTDAPALMPVFRSRQQGQLLARLLLHPDHEYSVTELARTLNAPKQTVQAEVSRLVDASILLDRRQGRNRLVSANTRHPANAPLTQLALMSYGPHEVIAEEFANVWGAKQVIIFGSWAARYVGEPGPPPGDIDVLVVGKTRQTEVFEAADRAHQRLGIEVNPEQCSVDQWSDDSTWRLVTQIRSRPFITVIPEGTQS